MNRGREPILSQRWVTATIFAAALLVRLARLDVPIGVDETLWIRRGPQFMAALLSGDWAVTYVRHHPGVTNMWLIGGALSLHHWLRDLAPANALGNTDLLSYLQSIAASELPPLDLYLAARPLYAIVTAASFTALWPLSRRLLGDAPALLAMLILLGEPFFLAYQRSITTDANQANFTWLALLAFLLALRPAERRPRRWLLLSGVSFGLALLSKLPALLSLPAVGLWVLTAQAGYGAPACGRRPWRALFGDLAAWGAAAVIICLALWPALWADPAGVWARLGSDLDEQLSGHSQFFLGQPTDSPGPAYYPIVLLLRLSPLLLIGATVGTGFTLRDLLVGRGRAGPPATDSAPGSQHTFLAAILLAVVVQLALLSVNDTQIDRYIVPVLPGLALLAGAGLWRAGMRLPRPHLPLAAAVIGVQLITAAPHFPYFLTYFNPLVGGAPQAERWIMVGNGELLDRAAAWIAAQPEGETATVASWYPRSFAPYFSGTTLPQFRRAWRNAHYVVIYINQWQRNEPSVAEVAYFAAQRPLHVVRAQGIDYARIYAGPQVRPIEWEAQRARVTADDLTFGESVRLLGHTIAKAGADDTNGRAPEQELEIAAGEQATMTLYWQALAPFPASDYAVTLRLRAEDGRTVAEVREAPVIGLLPVARWQPGQIIRDVHVLAVPVGAQAGPYTVELEWTSVQLSRSLAVRETNDARALLATVIIDD